MNGCKGIAIALVVTLACALAPAQDDMLWRWGTLEPAPGTVVAATPDGLVFVGVGGERTVAWSEVRRVDGPGASLVAPFATPSRLLWRAESRLARLDKRGAEPLFEAAADAFAPGAARRAALLGLLECRLARGAILPAVAAWEETLVLPAVAGAQGSSAVDLATGLAPALPPLMPISSSDVAGAPSGASGPLVRLWLRLAEVGAERLWLEAGDLGDVMSWLDEALPASGAGRSFAGAVLLAQSGDALDRAAGRERLGEFASGQPWTAAWVELALARADAIDAARDTSEARHDGLDLAVYRLTGLALDRRVMHTLRELAGDNAAVLLERAGRTEDAIALRAALRRAQHSVPTAPAGGASNGDESS